MPPRWDPRSQAGECACEEHGKGIAVDVVTKIPANLCVKDWLCE